VSLTITIKELIEMMSRTGFLPRAMVTCGLLVATHGVAAAQEGAAATPEKPVLTFAGGTALITVLIKPDRTADFEFVLGKLKDALQRSERPERKSQAAGWHVLKSGQPVQGNVAYLMYIDPVVEGAEYDITRLIAEVFPVEVQQLFEKYRGAFAGRAIADLTPILSMKQ
jgi:hypothetical protein